MREARLNPSARGSTGRVVIVEDEWIIAKDLERILVAAGHDVVATITDPAGVPGALATLRPDLALFDIRLGARADGIEIGALESRRHGVGVVYVSAYADAKTLDRAKHELCLGFVAKPFSESQVRATVQLALERVRRDRDIGWAHGRAAHGSALERLARAVAELDIRRTREGAPVQRWDPSVVARLSEREWEVVRGLVAHRRVGSIAKTLHISEHTVRNHLKSIYVKLDVTCQEELIERVLGRDPAAGRSSRGH